MNPYIYPFVQLTFIGMLLCAWNLAKASSMISWLSEACFLGRFLREQYAMSYCMFTAALFSGSFYTEKQVWVCIKIIASCFLSLNILTMLLYYLMLWINLMKT